MSLLRRSRMRQPSMSGRKISSVKPASLRSEEHTSELQSRLHLVCRLLLEKKKKPIIHETRSMTTRGSNDFVMSRARREENEEESDTSAPAVDPELGLRSHNGQDHDIVDHT